MKSGLSSALIICSQLIRENSLEEAGIEIFKRMETACYELELAGKNNYLAAMCAGFAAAIDAIMSVEVALARCDQSDILMSPIEALLPHHQLLRRMLMNIADEVNQEETHLANIDAAIAALNAKPGVDTTAITTALADIRAQLSPTPAPAAPAPTDTAAPVDAGTPAPAAQ